MELIIGYIIIKKIVIANSTYWIHIKQATQYIVSLG